MVIKAHTQFMAKYLSANDWEEGVALWVIIGFISLHKQAQINNIYNAFKT